MADTNQILRLAAIIREVDGTHSKGAAALAESILDHPRFRAVLADEPAVPQGREPAAVITEPSDEEWDALVERVWDKYQTVGYQGERFMYDGDFGSALDLVRKELSRWGHQPAPPADGEVAELVAEIRHFLAGYQQMRGLDPEHIYSIHRGDKMEAHITVSRLTRAAELLERLSPLQPVPVSVSERLPGPEDCDANGRCWLCYTNVCNVTQWTLVLRSAILDWPISHWLPAHALPLPEVGE